MAKCVKVGHISSLRSHHVYFIYKWVHWPYYGRCCLFFWKTLKGEKVMTINAYTSSRSQNKLKKLSLKIILLFLMVSPGLNTK